MEKLNNLKAEPNVKAHFRIEEGGEKPIFQRDMNSRPPRSVSDAQPLEPVLLPQVSPFFQFDFFITDFFPKNVKVR